MQAVQQLALIFVHPLDLAVKDGIGIDHHSVLLLHISGQALFVLQLDFFELFQYRQVVFIGHQLFQLRSVIDIAVSDQLGDQGGQARICLVQPAAVSDAVGHVFKLIRHDLVEILKDGFL